MPTNSLKTWHDVFENLEKLYQEAIEEEGEAMEEVEECHMDNSDDDETEEEQEGNDREDTFVKQIGRLMEKFNTYCCGHLPVLGFNSAILQATI